MHFVKLPCTQHHIRWFLQYFAKNEYRKWKALGNFTSLSLLCTLKFWVVLSLDPCSRRRLRGAISCDNERGITVVVQKISSNKCICLFTLFFHQFFFCAVCRWLSNDREWNGRWYCHKGWNHNYCIRHDLTEKWPVL